MARAFLDKMDMTALMQGITGGMRVVMVNAFKQMGAMDAQAAELADNYMMPEFKARTPELIQRFEDVLVQDFTVAELRAILNGESNDARRSAAAKAGQLPAHFQAAGQEWGAQVGRDVQMKNPDAFKGLSVDGKPPGQ